MAWRSIGSVDYVNNDVPIGVSAQRYRYTSANLLTHRAGPPSEGYEIVK